MNKVIAYTIAEGKDAHFLATAVAVLLTQGWQPFGSVFIDDRTKQGVIGTKGKVCCQPLVKYEL